MSTPAAPFPETTPPHRGFAWRAIAWGAAVALAIDVGGTMLVVALGVHESPWLYSVLRLGLPTLLPFLGAAVGALLAAYLAGGRGALHGLLAATVAWVLRLPLPEFTTAATDDASPGLALLASWLGVAVVAAASGAAMQVVAGGSKSRLSRIARNWRAPPPPGSGPAWVAIAIGAATGTVMMIVGVVVLGEAVRPLPDSRYAGLVDGLARVLSFGALPCAAILAGAIARRGGALQGALACAGAMAGAYGFAAARGTLGAVAYTPLAITMLVVVAFGAGAGWLAARVANASRG